jgi:hypothetical protein
MKEPDVIELGDEAMEPITTEAEQTEKHVDIEDSSQASNRKKGS